MDSSAQGLLVSVLWRAAVILNSTRTQQRMKKLVLILFSLAALVSTQAAQTIAQWNFNSVPPDGSTTSGTTNTSSGVATLYRIGGTTSTFATGNTDPAVDPAGGTDNTAINVATYPAAGAANKTAGIRLNVSTVGYQNITVSWSQRHSATASRYHRLQYSLDGVNFNDWPTAYAVAYSNGANSTLVFTNFSFDLSSISGATNNPDFAVQIVSEFESTAINSGSAAYVPSVITNLPSTYSPNGTVRFDMVTISGEPFGTPNAQPTISGITNVTMRADTTYPATPFTIGDAETAAANLVVNRSSSDTALLPLNGIVLGGSESNRTVTLTPAPNATGSAVVTLTVIDEGGKSNNTVFAVTVIPTNTLPTIITIVNQGTTVDTATAPISFTIGDAETAASNLTVTALSSNTTILPSSGIALAGTNTARTITLTPAPGQAGNVLVTISVSDGFLVTNRSFVLSVLPSAGTLFVEPFNYPNGSLITNSLGLWQNTSGNTGQLSTVDQILYVTADNSEDVSATLRGQPFTPASQTNIFFSLTVSAYNLPATLGDYFAHLKDNGSNFRGKLFASSGNSALGFYRIGIANGASFPTNTGYVEVPTDIGIDQTNRVVVRYNVGTGVATLWLNPTAESDSSVTATDVIASTNSITQFAIRETRFQGDLYVDDIRATTTFGEALGILPPPPVRLRIAHVDNSVVIAWPVSATGYALKMRTDVASGEWLPAPASEVIGAENVVTIENPTGTAFFRLVK
jgi:hypothetical protein